GNKHGHAPRIGRSRAPREPGPQADECRRGGDPARCHRVDRGGPGRSGSRRPIRSRLHSTSSGTERIGVEPVRSSRSIPFAVAAFLALFLTPARTQAGVGLELQGSYFDVSSSSKSFDAVFGGAGGALWGAALRYDIG